jgi:hypothetical protein
VVIIAQEKLGQQEIGGMMLLTMTDIWSLR